MTLLDNELVNKYFGCDKKHPSHEHSFACDCCNERSAYRVLAAMQEPIKPMEQALQYQGSSAGHWEILMTNGTGKTQEGWHPNELRLPDAFQPKAEKCPSLLDKDDCLRRHEKANVRFVNAAKKPDPVEEKIKEIASFWFKNDTVEGFANRLRELVAISRQHPEPKS